MTLIRKPGEILEKFNKKEIMGDIVNQVREQYPDYFIMIADDEDKIWDLLIIRTQEYTVRRLIGKMNHESIRQMHFQQVFAIVVSPQIDDVEKEVKELFLPWTTQLIVTNNPKRVMRALEVTI